MESKTINILGSNYTLKVFNKAEDSRLESCDGLCDETVKELLVDNYAEDAGGPTCKKNLAVQIRKNNRHEIIHAFLLNLVLRKIPVGRRMRKW